MTREASLVAPLSQPAAPCHGCGHTFELVDLFGNGRERPYTCDECMVREKDGELRPARKDEDVETK